MPPSTANALTNRLALVNQLGFCRLPLGAIQAGHVNDSSHLRKQSISARNEQRRVAVGGRMQRLVEQGWLPTQRDTPFAPQPAFNKRRITARAYTSGKPHLGHTFHAVLAGVPNETLRTN